MMIGPKKRVAVVGAGPGGLVAASKLLQTGKLSVTIFEKGQQIGGLWAANSLINPEMVCFLKTILL
jgi:cation diffusion facilitator CzcD-associated flavoprotein CzcO